MSEVIKDAPCLCKDDDMERMQPKRNFFQKILYNRLRKSNRSYLYPVLYSDGIISNAICDRICLLYTSPSPRDYAASRMPSSA